MRKDRWEIKLSKYIDDNIKSSYKLGSLDCFLFAIKAQEIIGDVDILSHAKKYSSIKEGLRQVLNDWGSFENIFNNFLVKIEDKKRAQKGDLVMRYIDKNNFLFGIINNGKVFTKIEANGYYVSKINETDKIWGVR